MKDLIPLTAILALSLTLGACATGSGGNGSGGGADDSDALRAKTYESEKDAIAASDDDDVICTYERSVGSHLKKSICMSAEERARRAEAAQEATDRASRTRNAPTSRNSDGL